MYQELREQLFGGVWQTWAKAKNVGYGRVVLKFKDKVGQ